MLGRHVARRTQESACLRHADGAFGKGFGETEIGNVDLIVLVDQDVLRFQVTMNDILLVRGGQRIGKLHCEIQHAFQGKLRVVFDDLVEVLAVHKRHGDELHPLEIAQVVDTQDVPVRDLTGEDELLLEAAQGVSLAHRSLAHHLDRDDPVELFVPRFVDPPHAALADHAFNVVPRTEIAARAKGRRIHHLYGRGIADGERFAALRASYGEIRVGRFAVRTVNHLDGTWRGNFKVELSCNRSVLCNWQGNRGSEIASQARGHLGTGPSANWDRRIQAPPSTLLNSSG